MRSNCVIFAALLWLRRRRRGREGYIMIRMSRLCWGPHVLYAERWPSGRWRVVSYKPLLGSGRALPPLVYRGESRWGDLPG
jgi:hypothetical protein